ncbi:MAG: hypothetical protein ACREAN_01200, partial [Nitrosopumilaceae archaeon]
MEEIALVFSSLAGACTAVALDKIPRRKYSKQTTMNSTIENQLHALRIERETLTKTISRLHREDSNVTKVQRDKLLIRYQHQLGIIIAKIEKVETASRYPDLGPIGDSLITLMDNKLSKLDQRLHEISSKISVNTIQPAAKPTVLVHSTEVVKQQEQPNRVVQEKPRIEKMEIKTEVQEDKIEIQKENIQTPMPPIEIPIPERRRSVELSTLTEIPSKMPEFPAEFIKPPQIQVETTRIITESTKSPEIPQQIIPVEPAPLMPKEASVSIEIPKPIIEQVEKKIQLPTPIKIPEEEKIENDD